MINQQLLDFIKLQLSKGLDKETITKELLGGGWAEADIQEGFNTVNIPVVNQTINPVINNPVVSSINNPILTHVPNHSGKKVAFIIVALFVIAGGASGYFFRNDIPVIKDLIKSKTVTPTEEIKQTGNTQTQIQKEEAVTPPPVQNQDVTVNEPIQESKTNVKIEDKKVGINNNLSQNTIKAGQKGASLGFFKITNTGTITNLYINFYGTANHDIAEDYYLYVDNKLIQKMWIEDLKTRGNIREGTVEKGMVQFGGIKGGLFNSPKLIEIRADINPDALTSTIGVKIVKISVDKYSNSQPISIIGKLYNVNGRNIVLTSSSDLTPRIALKSQNINQHIDINKKVWVTDPDERTGGDDIPPLEYCIKWYPNTVGYRYYKNETIDNWHYGTGLVSKNITNTVMTIECLTPEAQKVILDNQSLLSCQPVTLKEKTGVIFDNFNYSIIEPKTLTGCSINLRYINNKKPEISGKDMTCIFDNKIDFLESIQSVIMSSFSDSNTSNCSGPLYPLLKTLL